MGLQAALTDLDEESERDNHVLKGALSSRFVNGGEDGVA